jgi:hypothetical protein
VSGGIDNRRRLPHGAGGQAVNPGAELGLGSRNLATASPDIQTLKIRAPDASTTRWPIAAASAMRWQQQRPLIFYSEHPSSRGSPTALSCG